MTSNKSKIANIANYSAATLLFIFGIVYLFKASFMPYHSDAVSMAWNEVQNEFHFLILALMKVVGGGFIAASVAIAALQYNFNKYRNEWIPMLILLIGAIISATSIYATLLVRLNTPGNPPTISAIIGIILLIIGFSFNKKSLQ